MEIDKTTLHDLSIFNTEEEFSVFSKLNFCRTTGGKERFFVNLQSPLKTIDEIKGVQQTLQLILSQLRHWPVQISNGSILMIEKFYLSTIDEIPANPSSFAALSYKYFHGPDYSLVKYSIGHAVDFIKGMQQFIAVLLKEGCPAPLKKILQETQSIIDRPQFAVLKNITNAEPLNIQQQLHLANFLRYHYKQNMLRLLEIYFQLDAWYGMAIGVKEYNLAFPSFITTETPAIKAEGLYHLLLNYPVAYNITLEKNANFLFLTGANMAGKSTFIKSVGTAVFLAHTGMGVPAKQMQLSLFDGILSNINVVDNIAKGESYFYNEVQRIKATITKVSAGKKWLILIDELFKGTNIEDAMKCSSTVIEGLLKIENSLFILSTHLYEIGEALKQKNNIIFNYFETTVSNGQLNFSYQLKEGISNDRLGYLILQKEGVVKMLEEL